MLSIYRKIYTDFYDWKNSAIRKPLLVRGARQVGKSYAISHWAKEAFGETNFLKIDLEERKDLRVIFEHNLAVERIVSDIQLVTGFNLNRDNIILFIDEIQTCPSAITSLKYFAENMPHLSIIAAGSLIDFILEEISFPVGRVQSLFMFPLTFFEFLYALEKKYIVEALINDYSGSHHFNKPVLVPLHDEILRDLRLYFRVGGMPEAVASFIEEKNLSKVSSIQKRLISAYEDDFAKYSKHSDWNILSLVFEKAPFFVGSNRIVYSKFSELVRGEKIKKALRLLERAQILSFVYASYAKEVPLKVGINHEIFKLLFVDIGLLQSCFGFDWSKLNLTEDLNSLCNGVFTEQFVGQEILSCKGKFSRYGDLYYWLRRRKGAEAELDYLIEYDGCPTPIEVKSGHRGTLKSLAQYQKEFSPKSCFIASSRNIEKLDNLTWIPLYLASLLAQA